MVHMHKWLVAFPGSSLNNVQISITTIFLASAAIRIPASNPWYPTTRGAISVELAFSPGTYNDLARSCVH